MNDLNEHNGLRPEEREEWSTREKERVLKEADMLKQGGQYKLDKTGAISYEFSENQLKEIEHAARGKRISEFYEAPHKPFKFAVEMGKTERELLEEMIGESREWIRDANKDNGEWIIIPTENAIKQVSLRIPRKLVPIEQLLQVNERSEYPRLEVDYSLTLEQAIKAAGLDNIDNNIKRFPFETSGESEVTPELVRLGRYISWEEAEKEIDKMGLRPATLREFLAFAAAHPDNPNWDTPVVAIGLSMLIHLSQRTPFIHLRNKEEGGPLELDLALLLNAWWQSLYVALCVKK